MKQRIAKAISQSGVCSRRDAECLIDKGLVTVDGVIIKSPVVFVDDNSVISVNGTTITNQLPQVRLWRYYKPISIITTHKDPYLRNTVFENLPTLPRVISIGRLDINSEGLLLLTNSGALARKFELPSSKIKRVYKVRACGKPNKIRDSSEAVNINGVIYRPQSIKLICTKGYNSWFEVILTEGKNREVRKIFDYYGLKVNRLIRTQYGPFTLGNLKPGEYAEQKLENF